MAALFDGLQHSVLDVLAVPPGPRLKSRYDNLADSITTPEALARLVVLAVRNAVALFGAEQTKFEQLCALVEGNAVRLCSDVAGLRIIGGILAEIIRRPDRISSEDYAKLCVNAPEHVVSLAFARVAGRVVVARLRELNQAVGEESTGAPAGRSSGAAGGGEGGAA